MTPTPTIRPAGVADAPAVALLVHRLLGAVLPAAKVVPLAVLTDCAGRLLANGDIVAWLAEQQGAAVGVVTASELHGLFAQGAFGEISEIFVEPAWRSTGLAERLMQAACAYGRARGWSRIELSAPLAGAPEAARAYAFYRRLGFADEGPRLMLSL